MIYKLRKPFKKNSLHTKMLVMLSGCSSLSPVWLIWYWIDRQWFSVLPVSIFDSPSLLWLPLTTRWQKMTIALWNNKGMLRGCICNNFISLLKSSAPAAVSKQCLLFLLLLLLFLPRALRDVINLGWVGHSWNDHDWITAVSGKKIVSQLSGMIFIML